MERRLRAAETEPLEGTRWQLVKECLGKALDHEGVLREAYLDELAGQDPELGQQVRGLLRSHSQAGTFLSGSELSWTTEGQLKIGDRLGHYTIDGVLGEGGFSMVYSAAQSEPIRRHVAVKVIKPGMNSTQVLERFAAEGQTLARMQHPGIAVVLDSGRTPSGLSYFVMEKVSGTPITTFCKRGRLDLFGRLELFLQVCQAVQHAHQKGVVHRDLKPSNVLVEPGEGVGRVKVIDFGIAKTLLGDADDVLLKTQVGILLGTPMYMSPEQAAGSNDIDTRSDVYSMGVLLYELLSGHLPFDKKGDQVTDVDELRRLIRDVEPPKPSTRVAQMPRGTHADSFTTSTRLLRGDLDWIVMRALEKDRERRYPSADAMADDIERYLAHEPVSAGPPSSWYRMTKFARRNRGVLVAVIGVVLALAAGLGFATVGMREAERQTGIANEARTAESAARTDAELALGKAQEQERLAILAASNEAAARRAAEQSLEEAWASEQFLENMLRAARPDDQEGELTVRQALDQASANLAESTEFAAFPLVKARMHRVIAATYQQLGALAEADTHMQKCLAILEEKVGPNDEVMLIAQGALCSLRYDQSRHGEVEDLVEDLATRCREHLGADHELTMEAESRVAGTAFDGGDAARGVAILEDLIPRQKRVLGEDDDVVLGNMANLSLMYGAVGRVDDALTQAREALDASVRVHGRDHQRSLKSSHVLAMAFAHHKRWQEAIEVLVDLVERRTRLQGAEHMDTIGSSNLLALAYHQGGQLDLAEQTYRECLAIHRRVLGPDHRQTMMCLHNLGMLLDNRNKKAEAEPLLREAATRFTNNRGVMHPEALQARYHLASCIADQNRFAEIEPDYTKVLAEMFEVFGNKHALVREAAIHHAGFVRRYADTLVAKGEYAVAEALLLKVTANWTALGEEGFPHQLASELATIYRHLERPVDEKLWAERAANGR